MTKELRVSLTHAEQFLTQKYGRDVSEVQSLGEGAWSSAFSFLLMDAKHVLRWSSVPGNFARDIFAHSFSSAYLPIPPIKESGAAGTMYFAISPFVSGDFLETLSPHDLEIAIPSVIDTFRALRAIDVSEIGGSGFGFWNKNGVASHQSWKSFLLDDENDSPDSLTRGWREILENSEMGMDAFNKLWMAFQDLVHFCPEVRGVVHSDFVNRNVLVKDGKITAVLDWGSGFFGDPLYEIAWIKFCQPWFPASKDVQIVDRLLQDFKTDPNSNTENVEQRLLCYQLRIGATAIAHNAFRDDWKTAQFVTEYSQTLLKK